MSNAIWAVVIENTKKHCNLNVHIKTEQKTHCEKHGIEKQ